MVIAVAYGVARPCAGLLYCVDDLHGLILVVDPVLGKSDKGGRPGRCFLSALHDGIRIVDSHELNFEVGGLAVSVKREGYFCALRCSGGTVCVLPGLGHAEPGHDLSVGDGSAVHREGLLVITIAYGVSRPLATLGHGIHDLNQLTVLYPVLGKVYEAGLPGLAFISACALRIRICGPVKSDGVVGGLAVSPESEFHIRSPGNISYDRRPCLGDGNFSGLLIVCYSCVVCCVCCGLSARIAYLVSRPAATLNYSVVNGNSRTI